MQHTWLRRQRRLSHASKKGLTDREIISLYNSGQQEKAFAEIVDNYSERLYWHLRRFTSSHEDTDDLLQEVFIKVWAALPSFRGEARLFTWLYRIATNEALNYARKAKIREGLSFEPLDKTLDGRIDEDVHFNGTEIQKELLKAIDKLPTKQKLVFNMRYFDEMSYEEISAILNTSVGSLKASYHHAYVKVKDILTKTLLP